MNFASFEFWTRLAIAWLAGLILVGLAGVFRPAWKEAVGKLTFLGISVTLLLSQNWVTVGALAWVIGWGWLAVWVARREMPGGWRRGLSALLIVVELLPLLYFKYWGFLLNGVLHLGVEVPSILVPMGLSFHTFQTIAITVDSRPGHPMPRFLDYLNFSTFFPQIVAGPIERKKELMPQMATLRPVPRREFLDAAVGWIVLGMFCKLVLADNLAVLMRRPAGPVESAWLAWAECLSYSLRIYFDFAGYSFIAVGLGLLFGVRLTLNFRCPYTSENLKEFWRRWHTTLSRWLRDYVYFPLGGSRVRWWAVNTLIVFLVSGLWHGAGWNYLVWGGLHGLGVLFCSLGKPWVIPRFIKTAATLLYVGLTWLFFFERDVMETFRKIGVMLTPSAYAGNPVKVLDAVFPTTSELAAVMTVWGMGILFLVLEWPSRNDDEPYGFMRSLPASVLLVILTVLLSPMRESTFIYFNF